MRVIAGVLCMALFAGCSAEDRHPEIGTSDRAAEAERVDTASASGQRRGTVEIGLEDLRPAFTRDTVIELNGIVARSLSTIRQYDGVIHDLRRSVDMALADRATNRARSEARAGLERLDAFETRSRVALDDMHAAVAELEASGERYNQAILAGMVDFVEDVESELRRERERLSARLEGG